jgi:phosphatidate cytidylyltransferase
LKTRILSALAGIIILIIVMVSNEIIFGLAVFILSIIGINEIFNAFISKGKKPIKILGYIYQLYLYLL